MLNKKKSYEEITIKAAFGLVSKIIKNHFFARLGFKKMAENHYFSVRVFNK